jgi:hypothetical protein
MTRSTTFIVAILIAASASAAAAQTVVKREPPMGALKEGQRVLIDDGSCGPGKIKEATGGNHVKVGGNSNVVRTYRCIPR